MADEIDIDLAKFNFNTDDVVKGAQVLKAALDEAKRELVYLRKEGETSTAAYVETEAAVKALNKEYASHIKYLAETAKAAQTVALREQLLEGVLGKEVVTIKEAREQNKILNDLRNDTNVTTAQGQAELVKLNAQLDRNNALIKENVDQYTKQKINIGNYKESIIEALQELEKQKKTLEENNKQLALLRDETDKGSKEWNYYQTQINQTNTQINALIINMGGLNDEATSTSTITKLLSGDFKGLAKDAQGVGGAGNLMKSTLKGAASSLLGLAKAGLAFIATPIGAILAALVLAFLLIKNAMDRNEETLNKLKKAFAPFQGILSAVMDLLEPLGEFLIDGLVYGLEMVEKAIGVVIDSFAEILDFLGFDSLAKSTRDFNKAIQEGAQNAKDLADAEAELTRVQREARLVQLEYQKAAEGFRQIRDNENLSIRERIAANEQLGAVLEQQLQDELRIAQQALLVANLRIKADGRSAATLDAQAAALETIADIEERINSQRSEQLTNRVSLEKEAEAKRQEAINKRIEKMKEEMALYVAQAGTRAQTLAQELEQERLFSEQKKAILDEELKYKRLSETAYQTAILELRNALVQREAELAVENAAREIDIYKKQLAQKQVENQFLSDAVVAQKVEENNLLLQKETEFQAIQLEQGVVNQNEYDLAIEEAKEVNRLANKEIEDERIAVAKQEAADLRALEFEEELARLQEEGATKYELEKAQADEQKALDLQAIEADRAKGLISLELYEARKAAVEAAANRADLQREKILADEKLQLTGGLLAGLSGLIDKQSAAGKAIAIAQAGINTFQGITEGLKAPFPLNIAMPILAGVTGLAATAKIIKTKVPSASGGGSVGGGGGGGAQGIGGVNLGGSTNLTKAAASGNASVQDQVQRNAGGQDIGEQVRQGAEDGARKGSETGASKGITDLTDNRRVKEGSAF